LTAVSQPKEAFKLPLPCLHGGKRGLLDYIKQWFRCIGIIPTYTYIGMISEVNNYYPRNHNLFSFLHRSSGQNGYNVHCSNDRAMYSIKYKTAIHISEISLWS